MKKYIKSEVKVFAILTIVCFLMIVAGVVTILFAQDQLYWILLLLGFGISMGIVFLTVLFICARNYILLDDENIVFPITRSPKLCFKRNTVAFGDIKCIKPISHKGDGIISKDTTMYRFILYNGLEFTETFYSYGKESELEIVSHLKKYIHFS